ncbi:MAG: hypothetical protein WCR52_21600 [Bacteroidota bacterium]
MKQTLILLLLASANTLMYGQVTVLKPYKPTATKQAATAPAPATYSTQTAPAPQTYSTQAAPVESAADAAARRKHALSKVQGTQSKSLSAKGVSPAQYSTDGGVAPVEYSTQPVAPSTTMTVNGLNVQRAVVKGKGQVGNDLFTPVSELHYVQFAVYCKDTPVDKAPAIEGLFLLWHEGSKCPGGDEGASYIVKGYTTADEAKAAVLEFKAQKIDCWYNPALTGAEVEVIGVR